MRPRVLVVDDSATLRRIIKLCVASEGFEISEAASGEEALRALRIGPVDLLISDVHMPGMGGVELLVRLRSEPREELRRLAVVLVTSQLTPEIAARAAQLGAAVVRKPVSASELVAVLRGLLAAG